VVVEEHHTTSRGMLELGVARGEVGQQG